MYQRWGNNVNREAGQGMVIRVDVACDINGCVFGYGVAIQNKQGNIITGMHGHYPMLLSPLCVEARAVLEGLRLADIMEL